MHCKCRLPATAWTRFYKLQYPLNIKCFDWTSYVKTIMFVCCVLSLFIYLVKKLKIMYLTSVWTSPTNVSLTQLKLKNYKSCVIENVTFPHGYNAHECHFIVSGWTEFVWHTLFYFHRLLDMFLYSFCYVRNSVSFYFTCCHQGGGDVYLSIAAGTCFFFLFISVYHN